jgi:hypothetical protein
MEFNEILHQDRTLKELQNELLYVMIGFFKHKILMNYGDFLVFFTIFYRFAIIAKYST